MQHIRIPTPDAPASHHLTFICAVAELAHRILEQVTGLDVDLQVSIHNHTNIEREPALTAAAAEAGLAYREAEGSGWHFWGNGQGTRVTVFTTAKPAITLDPETTTELAQAVTAQLESATLAAQYTAANDARREG